MWTLIIFCKTCNQEINRVKKIPESQRSFKAIRPALYAICPNTHETEHEIRLEWEQE